MRVDRRDILVAGAVGLATLLSGCIFSSKPGYDKVNSEIASAPGVTEAEISGGPGGGLGTTISGTIALDVTTEELRNAFEEAWGRGVAVLHQMFEPGASVVVEAVRGVLPDGTEIFASELVDLGDSNALTMKHFYEHYGIE